MKNKQNININKSSEVKIGSINFNADSDSSEKKKDNPPENTWRKKELKEKIAANKITEVVKSLLDGDKLTEGESNFLYAILFLSILDSS